MHTYTKKFSFIVAMQSVALNEEEKEFLLKGNATFHRGAKYPHEINLQQIIAIDGVKPEFTFHEMSYLDSVFSDNVYEDCSNDEDIPVENFSD